MRGSPISAAPCAGAASSAGSYHRRDRRGPAPFEGGTAQLAGRATGAGPPQARERLRGQGVATRGGGASRGRRRAHGLLAQRPQPVVWLCHPEQHPLPTHGAANTLDQRGARPALEDVVRRPRVERGPHEGRLVERA